jgi:DNA (cytosine-5)-methyltransferase 1
LTPREFAALQSFPLEHVFVARGIRKQIGNAVPPMMAAIVLNAVREHLEKVAQAEMGSPSART